MNVYAEAQARVLREQIAEVERQLALDHFADEPHRAEAKVALTQARKVLKQLEAIR